MSFICQKCEETMPNGTEPVKVVVETRKKSYPVRYGTFEGMTKTIDNGGTGTEIVSELMVCAACAKKMKAKK